MVSSGSSGGNLSGVSALLIDSGLTADVDPEPLSWGDGPASLTLGKVWTSEIRKHVSHEYHEYVVKIEKKNFLIFSPFHK